MSFARHEGSRRNGGVPFQYICFCHTHHLMTFIVMLAMNDLLVTSSDALISARVHNVIKVLWND